MISSRQVLDSNSSGGLTSQEFCAAMKKLVQRTRRSHTTDTNNRRDLCVQRAPKSLHNIVLRCLKFLHICVRITDAHTSLVLQPFQPKLHLTDEDFLSITHNGQLCDAEGGLGLKEFELVMRDQVPPA